VEASEAIGGLSPVGHFQLIMIFIDEDLLVHEEIWAAVSTPYAVFGIKGG
jgi:prolyl-tRNA editing enzyme YbaK/EbsC (Cys-tRNA(Pro) deacylase)